MSPNKRFSVTLTFQFDVRQDEELEGDKLYDYSAQDWEANYASILEDKGVSEFLPSPLSNIAVKIEEAATN